MLISDRVCSWPQSSLTKGDSINWARKMKDYFGSAVRKFSNDRFVRTQGVTLRHRVRGILPCATLRAFSFMRCGSYYHRPSHADQLHVDLWWRGKNVLIDSGTYSYNAAKPFDEGFKGTRFHNTAQVDSRDQMDKVSRFLWLPWSRGVVEGKDDGVLTAKHDGFERLADPVSHRRVIMRVEDAGFLIVDYLRGREESHSFETRWLLPQDAEQQEDGTVVVPSGGCECFYVQMWCEQAEWSLSWAAADDGCAQGWYSRYYMRKERGHVLCGRLENQAATMVTWLGESKATIRPGDAFGVEVDVAGMRRHVASEIHE